MPFGGEAEGTFYSSGFGSTDQDDLNAGTAALTQYQSYMTSIYPGYTMSLAQLISYYQGTAGGQTFPQALGNAINNGGPNGVIPTSQVNTAMSNLASSGGGNIPANWSDFGNAIENVVTNPGLITELEYVIPATAGQVLTGAGAIGTSLVNVGAGTLTAVNLFSNFIWLIVPVGAWLLWENRDKLSAVAGGGIMDVGAALTKKAAGFITGENPRRRYSRHRRGRTKGKR